MFNEKIDEKYIVMQEGTSEGTQIKYYKDGYWYKKDKNGAEGLSEYLASKLLTYSDLDNGEYVIYEQGFINGKPGCRSRNFLHADEELVTIYRLYFNEHGRDLSILVSQMETMEERIQYVTKFVKDSCDLDITDYLRRVITLDYIILNEDRHFNNLALIFDGTGFKPSPIFDNGVSLLTANQSVERNSPISESTGKAIARPFSGSFSEMYGYFGKGFELDAISDGENVLIPAITEHIEKSEDNLDYVEYRIIRRDGEIRWVDDYGHYTDTEAYGGIYYVFISDITKERVRRESDLAIRQAVIEALSKSYHTVWLINDVEKETFSLYNSDKASNSARYMPEDITLEKANYSQVKEYYVNTAVAEEDRARLQKELEMKNIVSHLSEKPQWFINYLRMTDDNTKRYFRIEFAKVDMPNGKIGVVCGFKDVDDEVREQFAINQALVDAKKVEEDNRRLVEEVQSAAKLADLMGSVASLLSNMPAMSFSKDAETGKYRGDGYCAVHITGQVAEPGVYWLPADSIIQDVVELAGGLTPEADTFTVNLARRIGDGMRIHIPATGDTAKNWLISEGESAGNGAESGIAGNSLININTATLSELMKLSGVGESTAQDIISYREEHGNFSSIEEIMNVPGIKEAKFNKIRKYITV